MKIEYGKVNKILKPDIKRIIWCPHWTINDVIDASNFLSYYKYFLDLVKSNKGIELKIRPHPLLFNTLLSKNYLTSKQLYTYLNKIDDLENSSIDKNLDYFDLFKSSDMLISDNGSFLAEYLPTEKPIIYTHHYKNNQHNLNDLGIKLTK